MASSVRAGSKPFQQLFGQKQVFLPNFTITLLRTPHLPPSQASFIVPLNFTKLDLRDYLYHVYNVRCRNIRSYVKLQPAQFERTLRYQGRDVPEAVWGRRLWRPQSTKKMTVELEKPFIWPAVPSTPEEFEAWDKETHDAAHAFRQEQMDKIYDAQMPGRRTTPYGLTEIQRQAKELLEGKKMWRSTWKDIGEEEEKKQKEKEKQKEFEVDEDEPFVPTAR